MLHPFWQTKHEWIIGTLYTVPSQFQCNAMTSKIAGKVMVSGGILRGGTIIRECNTKKNVTDISQRQTTKKTIQESKIFRENTKNRSHALK